MTLNTQTSIFTEVADFIASQPSLEELAAYRVSTATQQFIDHLLEKNRKEGLSADERLQLEKFWQSRMS